MNKDLTEIVVVMDRSGSMMSCRGDAEGGLNNFVEAQKKQPGRANFTLVQFDTVYEFVHRGVNIQEVGKYTLTPRGNTALLDAVGRAIAETGERLKGLPDTDRPGLVVFVIVTDGQENSSKEFTAAQVREMITHQREKYAWQFTFLGADQDAFAAAKDMAIPLAAAANFTQKTAGNAYGAAARNVTRMRTASAGGQHVNCAYSDEERADMAGEQSSK